MRQIKRKRREQNVINFHREAEFAAEKRKREEQEKLEEELKEMQREHEESARVGNGASEYDIEDSDEDTDDDLDEGGLDFGTL